MAAGVLQAATGNGPGFGGCPARTLPEQPCRLGAGQSLTLAMQDPTVLRKPTILFAVFVAVAGLALPARAQNFVSQSHEFSRQLAALNGLLWQFESLNRSGQRLMTPNNGYGGYGNAPRYASPGRYGYGRYPQPYQPGPTYYIGPDGQVWMQPSRR